MVISLISAMAENRVIGNNNSLPWHLPADFAWFKEKTLGKTIILGFNTFKSIGEKPLPNRKHIILHNDPSYQVPESFGAAQGGNCVLATSIEQALELAKGEEEIMICGGASVYKQFLPLAQRLYLTYIHHHFEGDTFFPEFNANDFKEISRQAYQPDQKNAYACSFVILERK